MKIMKIIHIVILFSVIIFFCNCAFGKAEITENQANTQSPQKSSVTAQPQALISPSPTNAVARQATPTSGMKEAEAVSPSPTESAVEIPSGQATPSINPKKKPAKTAAQTGKIKLFIDKLIREQKDRKALTAKIEIKTTYLDADMTQKVKGDVMIKKPDKFYVHYTEPNEQAMISDGKMLWIYTPKLNQVIKQNVKEANLNMHFYIDLETSIAFFAKNSKTKLDEQNENYYDLKMIPLHKKDMDFDSIEVKIGKKDLLPSYMSMKMANTMVEVEFSDIVTYNSAQLGETPALSDDKFVFKAPEGVEEIDGSALTGESEGSGAGAEKKNKGEEK